MSTIDYDSWAVTYDSTRRACDSVVSAILEALGPASGRMLLDIGAGTGNFATRLVKAGFSVALCDISRTMLQLAATKLPATSLVVANAERLPYLTSSFSCAVCINVLPHLANRRGALTEARRILAEGPLVIRTTTRALGSRVLSYAGRASASLPDRGGAR